MAILKDETNGTGLLKALNDSFRDLSGGRTAVLFSGGLDSSLLAALARPFSDLRLYTVGYPGSHDIEAGSSGARELGLPWEPIFLDDDALRSAVSCLRDRFGMNDPVSTSFEVPLYIACTSIAEAVLLSGQGADELFGGYARYSPLSISELGEAREKDLRRLLSEGLPREETIARDMGKKLSCPYLHPGVVEVALSIPPGELIGELGNKQPLRSLALGLGLSSARAPKKAAQYGSGTMKAMKRLAAERGMRVGTWAMEVKG